MPPDTLKLLVKIIASYLSHNTLPAAEVPGLIRSTYSALNTLGAEPEPAPVGEPALTFTHMFYRSINGLPALLEVASFCAEPFQGFHFERSYRTQT